MILLAGKHRIRCTIVVVLIALLFAGLFLHVGTLPAFLTEIFLFLFLLTFDKCPLKDSTSAALADSVRDSALARAPPASFF
jgi:hypothetical protein